MTLDYIVNKSGGANFYDITKYRPYPTALVDSFLSSPDNKLKFGLNKDVKFGSQSGHVYKGLY